MYNKFLILALLTLSLTNLFLYYKIDKTEHHIEDQQWKFLAVENRLNVLRGNQLAVQDKLEERIGYLETGFDNLTFMLQYKQKEK